MPPYRERETHKIQDVICRRLEDDLINHPHTLRFAHTTTVSWNGIWSKAHVNVPRTHFEKALCDGGALLRSHLHCLLEVWNPFVQVESPSLFFTDWHALLYLLDGCAYPPAREQYRREWSLMNK